MRINSFTIGADPELFIINKRTGKVVSSIGLIPGEKGNPWVGEDMPKGFGLEIDNILAEFNIPPVKNWEGFVNNIQYMKDYIAKFVSNKNPDLGIKCIASQKVDSDQLQSEEAQLFGCDPDFNAYTQMENPKPKGNTTNLRSAGFHIHVGYNDHNIDTSIEMIKYMDCYLGIPSVVLDPDTKRRSLYGKAGSFRLQEWGLEYRCLSSGMMKDEVTLKKVWDGIMRSIIAYNEGYNRPPEEQIQQCINKSDVALAKQLIVEYNLEFSL